MLIETLLFFFRLSWRLVHFNYYSYMFHLSLVTLHFFTAEFLQLE